MQNYSALLASLKGSKFHYLNDWEKGFVDSVFNQHERGRELSSRQVEWLQKFDDKYSEENIVALRKWKAIFEASDEMRKNFRICLDYYKRTGYYSNIVGKYDLAEWVGDACPSELEYKKITANKYAQKILVAHCSEPRYTVGAYVALRSNRRNVVQGGKSVRLGSWNDDPVRNCFMVLHNDGAPTAAAKGTKKYKIIHMGTNVVLEIEERDIKKFRG